MAGSLHNAHFCLPPHFLSDHDNLPASRFPSHFPYHFESPAPNSALGSPVESLLGSNDADSGDEDDFLAALTHRLTQSTLRDSQSLTPPLPHSKSQAKAAMAGSPQSTLSGFGSWSAWSTVSSDGSPNGPSQAPSPPTTPFGGDNNTWDLIYEAAGQVARLKMNGDGLIGPPRSSNLVSSMKNPGAGLYSHAPQFRYGAEFPMYKPGCSSTWGGQVKVARPVQQQTENLQIQHRGRDLHHENGRFGRPLDLPQTTWPSLQPHQRRSPSQPTTPAVPPVFRSGGSAPKKECAGTGVFLPRRYDNPPQSRKRADCGSISVFPAKNVQRGSPSFEDPNRSAPPQTTSNRRLPPSYDVVMAERNAILAQQGLLSYSRAGERGKSHELLLPQEWTY